MVIDFGSASMFGLCGILFCKSLALATLAKGAFVRQLRNYSHIHLSKRKCAFCGLLGVCCDLECMEGEE